MLVATVVLDGVGRQLNPELNLIEASVPFIIRRTPEMITSQDIFRGFRIFRERFIDPIFSIFY